MRHVLNIGKKYMEITGPHTDSFVSELNKTLQHIDFSVLVLDLEGTKIVSSMALGAIFSVRQKLQGQGKALQIVNAAEQVKRLLRLVSMDDILG